VWRGRRRAGAGVAVVVREALASVLLPALAVADMHAFLVAAQDLQTPSATGIPPVATSGGPTGAGSGRPARGGGIRGGEWEGVEVLQGQGGLGGGAAWVGRRWHVGAPHCAHGGHPHRPFAPPGGAAAPASRQPPIPSTALNPNLQTLNSRVSGFGPDALVPSTAIQARREQLAASPVVKSWLYALLRCGWWTGPSSSSKSHMAGTY